MSIDLVRNPTISVHIRGGITRRIFKVWETQLPKIANVTLSDSFSVESTHLVVCKNSYSINALKKWLKGVKLTKEVIIVNSDWLVNSLKEKELILTDPYVHPLMKEFFEPAKRNIDVKKSENKSISIDTSQIEDISSTQVDFDFNMDKNTFGVENYNKHITDILEELQEMYELLDDDFRSLVYRKCSSKLKQLPLIKDSKDLKELRGFGKSVLDKIQEIINTGILIKLEKMKNEPKIKSILSFAMIWGVGKRKADLLYKKGFRSIEAIRLTGLDQLTEQQRIGLKHYNDFQIKIPRNEVAEIGKIVSDECERLFPGLFDCLICGSYRREKSECGDVDILITPKEPREETIFISKTQGINSFETGKKRKKSFLESDDEEEEEERVKNPFISSFHTSQPIKQSQITSQGSDLLVNALPQLLHSLSISGFLTDHLTVPRGFSRTQLNFKTQSKQEKNEFTQSQNLFSQAIDRRNSLSFTQNDDLLNDDDLFSDDEGYSSEECVTPSLGVKKKKDKNRLGRGYMGVCRLPKVGALYRRIDIKIFSLEQKPFALIYFTGCDSFLRQMKYYAKQNGYKLTDKLLLRKGENGGKVPCKTEKEVFEVLKIPYKEPKDRICFEKPPS